jgi:D-threo-aldose 1-dehydrogenase
MQWGSPHEATEAMTSGAEQAVFGVGRIHHLGSPRQRQNLLSAAIDLGFRAFDVAPAYGNGVAERELGRALRGRRERMEINSKVGIPIRIYPAIAGRVFPVFRALDLLGGVHARCYQRRDFSPIHIRTSVEASLRRLQTDRIDTLFLHEPLTPFADRERETIVSCLESLRSQGKILRFGVAGSLEAWDALNAVPIGTVLQCPLSSTSSPAARELLRDRSPMFYGAYARFSAKPTGRSFGEFVREQLRDLPGARMILSSTDRSRLRALVSP